MNWMQKRRAAMMGAKKDALLFSVKNVEVQNGQAVTTGVSVLSAGLNVTILFDFTSAQNPTSGVGYIYKLFVMTDANMLNTRELSIGKYNGGDTNLALWWMPSSNSDQNGIPQTTTAAGRKRIVVTHEADSDDIVVYTKMDSNNINTYTKTKTFIATTKVLSAGVYTGEGQTNNGGLPAGTIHNFSVYDRILTPAEIDAFFA